MSPQIISSNFNIYLVSTSNHSIYTFHFSQSLHNNYSNYVNSTYFLDLNFPISKNVSCLKCSFPPISAYGSTSSERDVIFSDCETRITNIFELVHTLRTCSCRALLFVFLDLTAFQSISKSSFYPELSSCHCFLVNYGTISDELNHRFPPILCLTRWFYIDLFLDMYHNNFNRCCHLDLFDTIFQADPFNKLLDHNFLVGLLQPLSVYNSHNDAQYIFKWLSVLKNVIPYSRRYLSLPIINGGFVLGPISMFRKYVKTIISFAFLLPNPPDILCTDQGLITLLYYSGIFEKNEIIFKFFYPQSYYLAEIPSPPYIIGKMREKSYLNPDYSIPVVLVHHYFFSKELIKSIFISCPDHGFRRS